MDRVGVRAATAVLSAGSLMRTVQGFEVGVHVQSEFRMVWEWPWHVG